MRVMRFTDLAAFAARAQPFLFAHEAEHCLPIGILSSRLAGYQDNGEPPYLSCVEVQDGRIALVAIQTPPHNLILSLLTEHTDGDAALQALARDAHDAGRFLPGVLAPNELAELFASAWSSLTGAEYRAGIRERIYGLRRVLAPRLAPGAMRRAEERDRELLRLWLAAFMLEEALDDSAPISDADIDTWLGFETNGMYLWEDVQPVCLCGFGGTTPHGIRIGPVYTPPELRGRGFASALVAATSQRLLDEGRQCCFLFTNLANPTSNHIYQAIGYEPVCDVSVYTFEAAR
jgi:hypothetical protein